MIRVKPKIGQDRNIWVSLVQPLRHITQILYFAFFILEKI
jgi:hypothetical protein